MAYHEAYWAATAAAAPVIALANTVALDAKRLTSRLVRYLTKASKKETGRPLRQFFWAMAVAGWPVSTSIYNYAVQFLVMMFALISLQAGRDFVSPYVTTVGLLMGLAIVAMSGLRFYLDDIRVALTAALGISDGGLDEGAVQDEPATADAPASATRGRAAISPP